MEIERKEGYLVLDDILKEIGVDLTDYNTIINSPMIERISDGKEEHFSFIYNDTKYYFKIPSWSNPYSELIIDFLADDFGINHVEYDLAMISSLGLKGLISKDFKKDNSKYISGEEIVLDYSYHFNNTEEGMNANNLEDIWNSLIYKFRDNPNKDEIVAKLMAELVNLYMFDILTYQHDRHYGNWAIEEKDDTYELVPIFDNGFTPLVTDDINDDIEEDYYEMEFSVLGDYTGPLDSIKKFSSLSSSDYMETFKNKLWIIDENNIEKVFSGIEEKTKCLIPNDIKINTLRLFKEYHQRLEDFINNKDVRKM